MLRFLNLLAPPGLIDRQRRFDVRLAPERLIESNGILHGELRARTNGEMRRSLGITQQHLVAEDPALVADHREVTPDRAVREDTMSVQEPPEDPLHQRCGFRFAHPIETCTLE